MLSLKKCYENRKKQLRKTLADETKQINLTGGGPPPKIKKDETDDLLISIINKHTLVGFTNQLDDDADETLISCENPRNVVVFSILDEGDADSVNLEKETFLPADKSSYSKEDVNWRKYNPAKLQEPISKVLESNSIHVDESGLEENVLHHLKSTPKSRRRPTTVVKTFRSSDFARKYDILLDKRLLLVEGQIAHMEEENALTLKKRKLEIELLEKELLLKNKNLQ